MFFEEILIIFITGLFILTGAIILNIISNFIGLTTWYDFIQGLIDNGVEEFLKLGFFSIFSLFIVYPFLLGLIAYLFYFIFN